MAQTYEIPLSPTPQTFGITLNGASYQLTVQWRNIDQGGWFLDIADGQSNPKVSGIPLVTGADLLAQYAYEGFGFTLEVQTDHDLTAPPTFTNLGVTAHLYAAW